ncbi:BRCA1-associated protein-like isoform X2 [Stegodyphus dumicola]|uniref:BRCA1-associated protein-like isoform X2 n=1 Tax=Stegodyphus dumicola TaxID=202533 RepID=UPI0015AD8E84|nr:BRCA1-associated protein-like isoform X2 [Stegodyphus dumicola]
MSVSLIALRLEIAQEYPLLPHIHFSASRQKRPMALPESNVTKAEGYKEDEVPVEQTRSALSIDKCRGSRKLQEMIVETVCNTEVDISSNDSSIVKVEGAVQPENTVILNETSKLAQVNKSVPGHKTTKNKGSEKKVHQNASKKSAIKNDSVQKERQKIKSSDDNVNSVDKTVPIKDNKTVNPVEETVKVAVEDVVEEEQCHEDPADVTDPDKRNRIVHSPPISFSSGNHFVEVTKGLLHLYKENQRTTLAEEAERSEMLCILAVPAAMTTHDLLQFVAPVYDDIEHMRIIRENKPNQYMVLIKFKNQLSADIFYKNFNGERFNSIEPEICHLAFVAKVETIKESEEACLPLPGHTELPTCPVCLERMDESVEGILTILCNHSFHGSCLAKWGDTSCPVCRYCQTPELMPDNRCVTCGSQDSLWICLICGHIGCGRYVDGHAYHHYLDTQHTYAMQLGNNRVWDYAGDNYVHRLVQNKADGKPVELEPRWIENEEKMDSMQLEYTYLLTSQLEAQRHYFEDRITRFETEALKQLEEMKEKTKHAVDERKQLEEKLNRVTKEKQAQEKKISQVNNF